MIKSPLFRALDLGDPPASIRIRGDWHDADAIDRSDDGRLVWPERRQLTIGVPVMSHELADRGVATWGADPAGLDPPDVRQGNVEVDRDAWAVGQRYEQQGRVRLAGRPAPSAGSRAGARGLVDDLTEDRNHPVDVRGHGQARGNRLSEGRIEDPAWPGCHHRQADGRRADQPGGPGGCPEWARAWAPAKPGNPLTKDPGGPNPSGEDQDDVDRGQVATGNIDVAEGQEEQEHGHPWPKGDQPDQHPPGAFPQQAGDAGQSQEGQQPEVDVVPDD